MFSITRVGPDLLCLAGCFSKNAGCRISGRIFSILQSNCPKHWIDFTYLEFSLKDQNYKSFWGLYDPS